MNRYSVAQKARERGDGVSRAEAESEQSTGNQHEGSFLDAWLKRRGEGQRQREFPS
jgi:hypothetical protein